MKKKFDVIFYAPEYYHTFDYCDALTDLGHRCRIYVPPTQSVDSLYSHDYAIFAPRPPSNIVGLRGILSSILFVIRFAISHFRLAVRGRHIVFFVRPPITPIDLLWPTRFFFGDNFRIVLELFRFFRCRLFFVPSGCRDQWGRRDFSSFDDGRACRECGFRDACFESPSDYAFIDSSRFGLPAATPSRLIAFHQSHELHFSVLQKYNFKNLFNEFFPSQRLKCDFPYYKASNLQRFDNEETREIRKQTIASAGSRPFRIYFSPKLGLRNLAGDLKGSNYVKDAVVELKAKGFDIETIPTEIIPISDVPKVMASCDLVIDQLLFGQWGSTGVEAMLVGVPLACYVRPAWKEHYEKKYGGFPDLIQTTPERIRDDILECIENWSSLHLIGLQAQSFAKIHYDVSINAAKLIEFLNSC